MTYDQSFSGCPVCRPTATVAPPAVKEAPPAPALGAGKRHLVYINRKAVSQLVREHGRRSGEEFLVQLDEWVGRAVKRACGIRNGGKKTLDACVAGHAGIK